MGTLQEDIKAQSSWLVRAFAADGLQLDYTINSLKQIDKFFEKHSKNGKPVKNGRLSQNVGSIFYIGSYVGETIVKCPLPNRDDLLMDLHSL